MARILVTLALAAYNNVANRWPPFDRGAYVPVNLLAAGALLAAARGPLGLSWDELGIAEATWGDALTGASIGAALAAPVVAVGRARPPLVADRRVRGLRRSCRRRSS
jgi:hypothetical protein